MIAQVQPPAAPALVALAAAGIVAHEAAAQGSVPDTPEIAQAKDLWARSPHGQMLERILPPSRAAQRVARAALRRRAAHRALLRAMPLPAQPADARRGQMECHGRAHGVAHAGQAATWAPLMKEMMAHVRAPTPEEVVTLDALSPQARSARDRSGTPGVAEHFRADVQPRLLAVPRAPRSATAYRAQWPAVVERMKRHMAWANVVVGASELRTVPELDTAAIVRLLQRHARAETGDINRQIRITQDGYYALTSSPCFRCHLCRSRMPVAESCPFALYESDAARCAAARALQCVERTVPRPGPVKS